MSEPANPFAALLDLWSARGVPYSEIVEGLPTRTMEELVNAFIVFNEGDTSNTGPRRETGLRMAEMAGQFRDSKKILEIVDPHFAQSNTSPPDIFAMAQEINALTVEYYVRMANELFPPPNPNN